MPKRDDFKTVLVIGSGPIVIGQACEFDYSGTQAIKTLKSLGYRVVLINSNPATIMTDPDFADASYLEPITKESILRIIKKENVDAILPTLGGQVALNAGMEVYESDEFKKLKNVKFIGINPDAIKKGEDRLLFKETMQSINMDLPKSCYAYTLDEALQAASQIGFPLIIRASYTLGGAGSGVAYNIDEFKEIAQNGIEASPINEILIEESLLGWKEIESEVIRDKKGQCVLVCGIENIDPMGIHTGDSITIAPTLTLSDDEIEKIKKLSFEIVKAIGVDAGGSNIQFAMNPKDGRTVVIEMNPRVSRSSALASKATGYPIAKISTLLAVGYTLDEIKDGFYEPEIDYIVVKVPKFAFEKFKGANTLLGTAMKSVGEVMSLGKNLKEALQKALCSMESGLSGFDEISSKDLVYKLRHADDKRILYVAQAFREGYDIEKVYELTKIDKYFLNEIYEIVEFEKSVDMDILNDPKKLQEAKIMGFSDKKLAYLINLKDNLELSQNDIYFARNKFNIAQIYQKAGTKGRNDNFTYLYSTFKKCENVSSSNKDKKVLIIGGGPNRIGQGIEFDYCCVHASYALKDLGIKSIMYNCNPETVSTDYDTSDTLYFEPIDFEHLRSVIERENPDGVIIHFGGQTPLKFAKRLAIVGANVIGTSPRVIDMAEDRKKFSEFISKLGIKQPNNATATSVEKAVLKAKEIGYPVLVRPSYVLGGRAMKKVSCESELLEYMGEAVSVSNHSPVLIDKFLKNATELDVDAISDGKDVFVGAILEHIEEAGIHSGDSISVMPPQSLSKEIIEKVYKNTKEIAINLGVVGLLNIQFAIFEDEIYMIEVNPRASRTVPFVSKATGIPMAKVATRVMWQGDLKEALNFYDSYKNLIKVGDIYTATPKNHVCVKESVFPFNKLVGADFILGPEMKSTGEVMGISDSFAKSFIKSQISASNVFSSSGTLFLSLADDDKKSGIELAKKFIKEGFRIVATSGTHKALKEHGIESEFVHKISEGRPNIADKLKNNEINLVVNTSDNKSYDDDGIKIRQLVLRFKVPYFTTTKAALMAANSIPSMKDGSYLEVKSIQDYLKE
ncbi:carbamoyl-phosphate synthase large subunit [Campylobacter ureolyticus]|uniref:carbamoyl-phosphate synthase large subunit n=1 Tax=Campylobacter ureolyticus TaxID=827 RepID=UPI0022B2ED20|nr:carbamoyl-phosphate synthase large subunit [Campylobacter ureolyticus]MCZ6104503.1 carbamoyl-phosphate synthase large subunit [Campylobacter ureolyticus]MCZ6149956.1 carbamoyl-phosphate synthase large subunit [Campylobacter ureolyticus]MCZ6157117.1 carbamoyl-phosphate synthase large subunit [Campylobacter ureolyticus]